MSNRLYDLPDKIQTLIWKYFKQIVLNEMYNKYFIKEYNNNDIITWADYYDKFLTGGMIFRNLSYTYISNWMRNKGTYQYSGSEKIQNYMFYCWYKNFFQCHSDCYTTNCVYCREGIHVVCNHPPQILNGRCTNI